jgi:hypothetical protein
MLVLLMEFMYYAVDMGLRAMINIPDFIKIRLAIQTVVGETRIKICRHPDTNVISSAFYFFPPKIRRVG